MSLYVARRLTIAIGKAGRFWLYAGFGVAAIAFFWRWLPETKGRTLEQIEQQVHGEEPPAQQAA